MRFGFLKVTNPKPRDFPVSLSCIKTLSTISPYLPKYFLIDSSERVIDFFQSERLKDVPRVVIGAIPPMNIFPGMRSEAVAIKNKLDFCYLLKFEL